MRVEPHAIGSYLHCIKRGARGMEIVKDEADRWRFIKSLFYLNNKHDRTERWDAELRKQGIPLFEWPEDWPPQDKLVDVLAFILMPNHFHILLRETCDDGISLFMKKICSSMTMNFNDKYAGKGSIFQGSYKGKLVASDEYLRRVAIYIMVKNSFELLPGGIENALKNFDAAWKKSIDYDFSSLADYAANRKSPIIDKGILNELFESPLEFKSFSKDVMLTRNNDDEKIFEW